MLSLILVIVKNITITKCSIFENSYNNGLTCFTCNYSKSSYCENELSNSDINTIQCPITSKCLIYTSLIKDKICKKKIGRIFNLQQSLMFVVSIT